MDQLGSTSQEYNKFVLAWVGLFCQISLSKQKKALEINGSDRDERHPISHPN